jgi:hypothetical protein
MAITTNNGKLAIMEFGDYWEPGLPMSPGALGTDDQQQLLWGFPEILWGAAAAVAAFWCALTGVSGVTGGGDLANLGG